MTATPSNRAGLLLTFAFVALLAACGGPSRAPRDPDGPVPTIAPTSAGQPPAAPLDGAASKAPGPFSAFAGALTGLKSYRAKVSLETPGQPKIEAMMEAVAPDRFHVSVTAGVGINFEMIGLSNETYMKLGGTWQRTPGEALLPFSPAELDRELRDLAQNGEASEGGLETVEGIRCQVFTVTGAATGQTAEDCVADGNVVRRFTTTEGATRISLVCSDVNASISIKAPL